MLFSLCPGPPLYFVSDAFQVFKLGIEEGKELWDRREGRTPETAHNPVDFLDAKTWPPDFGAKPLGPIKPPDILMVHPPAPDAEMLCACTSTEALAWLRRTAAHPMDGIQVRVY